MKAVELVFAIGWGVFWLSWLAAALATKRGRISWSREIRIRIVIFAVAVVAARFGAFHGHRFDSTPWRAAVGLVLFAAGLAIAVWARIALGRNWGTPMTRKSEPELVTSGPYRFVRHPIYSGIILAGIGTAVGVGWFLLPVLGLAAIYFVYSAFVEEAFMTEQFPNAYPAYVRSTKRLIPFVY